MKWLHALLNTCNQIRLKHLVTLNSHRYLGGTFTICRMKETDKTLCSEKPSLDTFRGYLYKIVKTKFL